MRAVVQRVKRADVRVGRRLVGEIGTGLLVLAGVADNDTSESVDWMAEKIVNLRVFDDEEGKMNRTLAEAGGAILCVSQFTLMGDCRKGRRPSYDRAAAPETARSIYELLVAALRVRGARVETGEFRALMDVELVNDGPVTLLLDSEKLF
ncbi:MAG: D-tyrosyl-tRNA(Tyr) deacylase [Acidobacteria bacterium]|nr:D-tyrosyl-tRNA(Tyr) deacylase [Acidobacteriota bacterium]